MGINFFRLASNEWDNRALAPYTLDDLVAVGFSVVSSDAGDIPTVFLGIFDEREKDDRLPPLVPMWISSLRWNGDTAVVSRGIHLYTDSRARHDDLWHLFEDATRSLLLLAREEYGERGLLRFFASSDAQPAPSMVTFSIGNKGDEGRWHQRDLGIPRECVEAVLLTPATLVGVHADGTLKELDLQGLPNFWEDVRVLPIEDVEWKPYEALRGNVAQTFALARGRWVLAANVDEPGHERIHHSVFSVSSKLPFLAHEKTLQFPGRVLRIGNDRILCEKGSPPNIISVSEFEARECFVALRSLE